MALAIPAVFNRALLGTQPVHVQSPPRRFCSIKAVLAPREAAIPAAVSPAAPPPITVVSKSIAIGASGVSEDSLFWRPEEVLNSQFTDLYHVWSSDAREPSELERRTQPLEISRHFPRPYAMARN